MNHVIHREGRVSRDRSSLYQFLLLAGLVTSLTLAAVLVYPTWDDGRIMLLIRESGVPAIQSNYADRPLVALFLTFLLKYQLFLPVGIVLHWVSWLAIGLITMRLWRLMFPAQSRMALFPALLSVAPILCKVQFVLLNIVLVDLVGPVLCFFGVFLLLSTQRPIWRKVMVDAAGLALVVLSILISQYAVPTAAIGFILLTAKAIRDRKERRREPLIVAALVAISTLGSFLIFSRLAESGTTALFRPSFAFQSFWRIKVLPFRLLSGLWRGVMGGVLEALGSVTLDSKPALLGFVCGVLLSGLVFLVVYKKESGEVTLRQDWRSVVTLLTGAALALVPILLMGRTPGIRWESRFWLPMLPVLSCLTVFTLLQLLRRRLWVLVPILCGFLTGYWTTLEIAGAFANPGGY